MSVATAEPIWTWPGLCAALQLPARSGPDVWGLTIDSRRCQPGDLFIALPGDPGPRFTATDRSDRDGHDFAGAAAANGAVGALVHRPVHDFASARQLQVDDTLDGLWALAANRRSVLSGPVIAVTGSSGKTTCKTFLAAALGAFASEGSLNNHIGVPLSLARTPASASSAVYEVGMNHPGEIGPLSTLLRPQIAVLLNVHPAHAAAFKDADGIRREKLSICDGLVDDGVLVIEQGIARSGRSAVVPSVTFGVQAAADVVLLDCDGGSARYRIGERTLTAAVPGGGWHRALTLAAVLAVLLALNRDSSGALSLPAGLVPAGRGNVRTTTDGVTLIDDSYNANPASMAAALNALAAQSRAVPGSRYALLGEMLELGADSPHYHLALADACRALDGVYLVGTGMRALADELGPGICLGWWPSVVSSAGEPLLNSLDYRLRKGDKLLIKGSNKVFWQQEFVARILARLASRPV